MPRDFVAFGGMKRIGFLERLQSGGDELALTLERGADLTYRALFDRANIFAGSFGPVRTLVLVEMASDVESIAAYLGALCAGHAVILAEPGSARAKTMIERYEPSFVVQDGKASATGLHAPDLHADLAVLMPTSGSSGKDKLVRLSSANVAANADSIVAALSIRSNEVAALTLPLHYSYGLSILNSHLAAGAAVRIVRTPILDPSFPTALDGCTSVPGVPYSYDLYERIGLRECLPASVRTMTSAGGALGPNLVRTYAEFMETRGGMFFAMYGQTEATARIAVLPPPRALVHPGELGNPIPGGRFELIDHDGGKLTWPGETGELVYRGPNVMMGYAETPEDLSKGAELDYLATGDLAVHTETGGLRIVGRKSRFSKIAGIRIGHEDAERALVASGIAAVVVGDDRTLVAVVPDSSHTARARARLSEITGLPRGHAESIVIPVLPRLISGKTDIPALTREALRQARAAMHGDDILASFREMFHPRPVRESDSFVSLGGDSLAFVQMSLALERKLGAVPEGWERKPAGQLARFGPQKARNWAAVDTDIVLRGLAVLFVAFHHATQGPYVGGAAALLLLAGYSLGRFQSGNLFNGQVRPVFAGLGRIVVPYFILLAFCAAMEGGVPWQKWLLLGNLGLAGYSPDGTLHVIYWFVEAYVQIVVAGALLFLLPPVRRAVAAHPLIWGLVLLAAALAARAVVRTVVDDNTLRVFATPSVLYVFAFGWCIYFARTRVQKIAVSLIAIAIFPLADPPVHNFLQVKLTVVLAACALLLWRPRLALPKPLVAPTLVVGVASYYIYLVHNLPAHFLFPHFAIPEWAGSTVNFVTGIALGLAVYGVQLTIERAKRTRRRAGGALATSAR